MKYLEAKLGVPPGENKAAGAPSDNKTIDDVQFASAAARIKATELELDPAVFARRRKSSDGGFTVADVERIHAATDDADEEE